MFKIFFQKNKLCVLGAQNCKSIFAPPYILVTDKFVSCMMVTQLFMYIKPHQIVHIRNGQFVACQFSYSRRNSLALVAGNTGKQCRLLPSEPTGVLSGYKRHKLGLIIGLSFLYFWVLACWAWTLRWTPYRGQGNPRHFYIIFSASGFSYRK